ncbi:ArsR family transcriptional regulator [Haladaptatus sp. CMAA 1911]|uniref:ArsR family transcriptional regulator n=1 Tax=unclassified Haladaptatus TaxID=2622732 RepID=UPI003754F3D6
MTRRKRGRWMNTATDPVLEFLDDHDIAVPIGVLDNELQPGYRTIKRALEELEEREFIERDENYSSHFRITERGREYLIGELDASER